MTNRKPSGEVFGLFPIPVQRVAKLVPGSVLGELLRELVGRAQQRNAQSEQLTHTEPVAASELVQLEQLSQLLLPHVSAFGELLFGESLTWSIKEMWLNVLEPGGRQALHNHANSFVSGVVYLTDSHASASTMFVKAAGSADFVFNNTNARAQLGPYNAGKWVSPDASAGDLLLFPSYLLHEVPVNRGERRVSLAFNAIPDRLDSWGYTLSLSR